MRSLRRLSGVTFLGTALLLGALVLTGFRQNSLMSDYSTIVKESESTIFLYATIREQATEGLFDAMSNLDDEMEVLDLTDILIKAIDK